MSEGLKEDLMVHWRRGQAVHLSFGSMSVPGIYFFKDDEKWVHDSVFEFMYLCICMT